MGGHGEGRRRVRAFPDAGAASLAAADRFVELARAAVDERGRFTVALAGGEEPAGAYAALAGEPRRSRVPWNHLHVFLGDERMVPPGHPRSNFRMAARALLDHVPLPEERVHRMPGELPPPAAAAAYEQALARVFGEGTPRFDLIHLGIGEDGHCASWFPFQTDVLHERDRRVVPAFFRPAGEHRLTLTVPVVNAARVVDFLVLADAKARIVRRAVRGPLDPLRIPAQLVRPADGTVSWLLSAGVAAGLPETGAGA